MKKNIKAINPFLIALVSFMSGGIIVHQKIVERSFSTGGSLLQEVKAYVREGYVEGYPESSLDTIAIKGFLKELGDPHTAFLNAKTFDELRIQTQGDYGGLGIQIAEREGWITVISPLPNTPAKRAGILAGDRIIEVEGKSTHGWKDDEAVQVLRGGVGKPINFVISRPGVAQPIAFRLIREEIRVSSVPYFFVLSSGIGYVRLNIFGESSDEEMTRAILQLKKAGINSLVLDLRQNPGGLLEQGIKVSDLFLPSNREIVETRGRTRGESEVFTSVDPQDFSELKVVVLIDEYSASASEIVAGALQDHDRALIVGMPSFGKGSVQTLLPLSGGNYLKMTTGKWYTPAGRSIHKDHNAFEEDAALHRESPIAEDGTPLLNAEAADTLSRMQYRTSRGRIVYGGGGIVPDVIVRPDTLSLDEKKFFEAVSRSGAKFNDAIFATVLGFTRSHPSLKEDFILPSSVEDALYRNLAAKGIRIERRIFDASVGWIRQRLAAEILNSRFGEAAAARRAALGDDAIQTAIRLLREARTSEELLAHSSQGVASPVIKK